jgi:hypothetical protein
MSTEHRWPMAAYLLVAMACALAMVSGVRVPSSFGRAVMGEPGRALAVVASGATLVPRLVAGLDDLPGAELPPATGTAGTVPDADAETPAVVVRRPATTDRREGAGRSTSAGRTATRPVRPTPGPATTDPRTTLPGGSVRSQPAAGSSTRTGTGVTHEQAARPGRAKGHGRADHAKRHGKADRTRRHGNRAANAAGKARGPSR